MTNRGS